MIAYNTALQMAKRERRLVAAIKDAVRYLKQCSALLDGPGEWQNPNSGVGGVVARLNRVVRRDKPQTKRKRLAIS